MKKTLFVVVFIAAAVAGGFFLFRNSPALKSVSMVEEEEDKEDEVRYTELRAKYEFDMLKDPAGKIPYNIKQQELTVAKTIPERGFDPAIAARPTALNNYFPAGPNNQGGRTRAITYDVRYNGTSNQILIAGGVSGGIFRSTDGGANWLRVSPEGEIHNVTCIVQDPRAGSQDIWYAGGGEPFGNSANGVGAAFLGFGLYKSTDNGASWTRLPLNTTTDIDGVTILGAGTIETFDHPFDYVHKLIVDPVNGNLYVGGHRRLVRSTDGGATFRVVFGGAVGAVSSGGQMDIVKAGTRFILAVNGGNPDASLRGVWTSATGNPASWTRIAGGTVLGVDSVLNWRANSYILSGTTPLPKRIVLAAAPSNSNIVYVCYENGLSNVTPDNSPEADMFKLDMTTGNTWTNLSANMPDFPGAHAATDPFAIQGGYDLLLSVKPDNANFVLLGGTSLYRSTDGFTSTTNTSWIGGYGNTLPTLTFYANSHPDIHAIAFHPTNFNEVICGNDGGMQLTSNITAGGSTVAWTNLSNYQTLQYYFIAIDPETGRNNFIGGAQDNGTHFRDKTGVIGVATVDSNNHRRVIGGDGCAVAFSKLNGADQFVYGGVQLGSIRRGRVQAGMGLNSFTVITPNGLTQTPGGGSSEFGEFVTNFRINPDNTEDLYYVNFNRLFRTTSASTVTASGWTELTGVGSVVNPTNPTSGTNVGIRALAFSRGPYTTSHMMYIGTTNGKIIRVSDPRNVAAATPATEITPNGIAATSNVQDIAVNPNNDDEVIAVISNYGVTSVWWTNNARSAAPTWRNAEGNLTLPSIRSCVIVVKKDGSNNPVTEYYLGTSVGLYSATDIGTTLIGGGSPTWQREGGNVLNFAIIQSLAYRPGDNVLLIGTHGNGMYYTFLGTPNFIPNPNTGNGGPTVNDKNFITTVFPTISSNNITYRTGNLLGIRKISLQVFSMSGQLVLQRESGYQTGSIDIAQLAKGAYILSIYSDDRKYRHLQKIVRE
jgi:hypothetical protein